MKTIRVHFKNGLADVIMFVTDYYYEGVELVVMTVTATRRYMADDVDRVEVL